MFKPIAEGDGAVAGLNSFLARSPYRWKKPPQIAPTYAPRMMPDVIQEYQSVSFVHHIS
jgi:hypothetical protein